MKSIKLSAVLASVLLAVSSSVFAATQDLAGNNLAGVPYTSGQTYILDATPPDAPTGLDLNAASDSGPSNTDNLTNDTTPTINGSGEVDATVTLYDTDGTTSLGSTTVSGGGTWSITASAMSAGAHTLTAKQIDTAGNTSLASDGFAIVIDTSGPAVSSSVRANSTPTNASSVQFTVTFSENVTGVDASDFSLAATGTITGASITNVSGSDNVYTVTAGTGVGSGTLKLNVLDDDSIIDGAGNPTSTGYTSGQNYTIDKTAPAVTLIVRAANTAINSGASDLTFRVTFGESVSGVDISDFTLASSNGNANGTLTSVTPVSATVYDVSVNQVSGIGQLSVSLNNSGTNITDAAGNTISGGYTAGDIYLVGTTNVLDSLSLVAGTPLDVSAAYEYELAQPFKTPATEPLTVYRLAARIGAVENSPSPIVTINEDMDGAPGNVVAVLSNPSTLVADSFNVWTTNTALAANTNYWIVFSDESETGRYFVAITSAVSGGLGDWFAAGDYSYGIFDLGWAPAPGALHLGLGAIASPAITSVTAPENARYRSGQVLDFTVNYDAAVTVDNSHGSPRIPLTIGSSTVYASYESGSPGTALVFRYTVQAGDNDADGIAVASPIDLNGSTIQGTAEVDALLAFSAVNTSGILIDNTAPAVTSVSVPSNGTFVADQNLDFTVNFSENVTVDSTGGTPRLGLTIGSATVYAVYQAGTGTTAITFRYTVQVDDLDTDGVSVGNLEANGGTLRDLAGNDTTLTLNSVGATANVWIDAVVPTITSVTAPAAAHYRAGQALSFTVNFTENITVNTGGGTPLLALTVGATTRYADYVSGSGTSALVFSYTVQAGETDDNGIESGVSVTSNGGTLRDPAGNNAALSFSAPSLTAVRVDTTAPTTSIGAPSASLTRGGPVTFEIAYTDAHLANSTLSTDGVTLNATGTASGTLSVSGSGTARTVEVSSITGDGTLGVSIAASTASDEAGNAASAAGPSTTFTVDNTAPTLTAVGIASNNTDTSRAKTGDVITVSFSASETIVSPTATIAGHAAEVTNPTGNNWVATATLEAGDNAGTVVFSIAFSDLAGNAATAVTSTTNGSTVAFDGAAPTLTSVAIASNNAATAWAKVGDDVVVTFTANETIATPTATIAGRAATIAHTDGNTWTATVAMTSGDAEGAVGFSISFSDLSGNAGTAVMEVTNESSVVFDKTAPAISIGAPSIAQTNTGPVTFTVTYTDTALNEVTLGNADVTLNTNDTATADVTVSGTGNTRTITLTHISGDGTLDITLAANTASDMAGNLADASGASATFNADNTAPVVMMIGRQSPITINNDAHTLTWRLIFAEDVTGVDAEDLVLTTVNGTSAGQIASFTPISASTYDIVVDHVSGRGQLRVDLKPSGTAIEDIAGNPLADGGFTKGDFYITGVLNVFQTTEREVDGLAIVQHSQGYQAAQRFTTAADAPLTLTTVTAWVGTIGGAPTPLVTIHAVDSSGGIGDLVTTLENPSALVASGLNVWTSSQLLEANTTYWVVFSDTSVAGSYEIACSSHGALEGVGSWLGQDDYRWRADVGASAEHNGTLNLAIGATSVPAITSTLTASGTYGSAFAGYSITATELPTSYRASGLPTGLSLNEETGLISGAPTQTGTFNVALTATNASGEGAPSTLVIEIEKAPLLVTANAATRAYGAANPTFTVSYTGFVNEDTAAALTTPAEATSSANITSVVGTYDIVPSGGSAANYTLSYANGTLTVTKATAAIAFTGLVKSYTGMALPVTATTNPADLTVEITYNGGATVPFMPGSYPVVATVVDANYQGSASDALVIGKIPVTITLDGLSQVYTGAAKAATASITPTGLPVTLTYDGGEMAPINAGEYEVHAIVDTATHAGSVTHTLTIEKATQTIAFTLAQLKLGSAATLSATATSNLPVSFELISGPATLNGTTLTPTDQGSVTVRATQAGNRNYFAATAVEQTVEVTGKLSQTITFAEIPARSTLDGAFRLSATASSGLSVTFKILSGPASLAGRSLIPAGTPGTVMVQASQAGNDKYAAADNVVRSFEILAEPDRVFFGDLFSANIAPASTGKLRAQAMSAQAEPKVGDVAAVLPSQNKTGSLLIVAPSIHINALVSFTLAEDNTFTTTVQQGGDSPTVRTLHGELSGTILSGEIEGTGLSFATEVESESGPSAEAAGLYRSAALETAQGTTYTIIGSNNNVLVLAVTPTLTVGGPATLDASGSFELQTSASNGEMVTLQGAVDTPTTTVAGTILVPSAAPIDFAGLQTTTSRTDRLFGLSSRGRVGAGEKILISGVVIGGSEPKPVLIRAIGPALGELGVANTLVNPRISLFKGSTLVGENDNWATADNADEIEMVAQRLGVFGLSRNSKDATLLRTLAPGAYTVHVHGGEGVALVEVYDASENPQAEYQRLVDISTRGEVGTGENVLIGGLAIAGNSPKRVLIRGVGPGLTSYGVASVLADPVLRVYRGNTVIGENDNWSANATQATQLTAAETTTGAFHLAAGSKDAAILLTLAPGNYTVHVSGANNTTGVALVEIYEVADQQ